MPSISMLENSNLNVGEFSFYLRGKFFLKQNLLGERLQVVLFLKDLFINFIGVDGRQLRRKQERRKRAGKVQAEIRLN